jgi:hypothetical protein
MPSVTLEDLFKEIDGMYFASRRELEGAVLERFNQHVAELPVGYSYKDAIDGARSRGWLITNGDGHGVKVRIGGAQPMLAH